MVKKINKSELAKKYALALYEQAIAENQEQTVCQELADLSALLKDSVEFKMLVTSPFVNKKGRAEMFGLVAEQANLSDIIRRFFGVLIENSRLNIFPEVQKAFTEIQEKKSGILCVNVVTAQTMTESTQKHLTDVLNQMLGKEIRINAQVNPALIGGLTVQVGTMMADASVKTKLQKLNLVMKGVGA